MTIARRGLPAVIATLAVLAWAQVAAPRAALGQVMYTGDLAVQVGAGLNPPIPHHGNPVTGAGVAVVGGGPAPRSVMLPAGFFTTMTSLIAAPAPGVPVDSRFTTFSAMAGTFSSQGGPGNLVHPVPGGQVNIIAGGNKFGGTMQLLGTPIRYLELTGGPTAKGSVAIPFTPIGGMNGATAMLMTPWTTTTEMGGTMMTSLTVTITGFGWTTGTVTASLGGATVMATGFDNRNPAGTFGSLQLVTPALVRINSPVPLPCATDFPMVLTSLPEPGATSLLGVGLLGLFAMAWRRG